MAKTTHVVVTETYVYDVEVPDNDLGWAASSIVIDAHLNKRRKKDPDSVCIKIGE